MNKTLMICAAVTGVSFMMPVLAEDKVSTETTVKVSEEKEADGSYTGKKTTDSKTIDASGTLNKTKTSVKVDAEADGDQEKTVTTESVVDPKGLMNKTKTVTKDSVKVKNGETEVKHTKKINGDTVESTTEASPTAR